MSEKNEWKLVPATMTLDMCVAFAEAWFSKVRCIDDPEMQDAYAAMLAAAPSAPGDAQDEDDSIALDKLADYIADTWPDKKYGLEEICQRLHAMWPGEFLSAADLEKNDPNVREALRALLLWWDRFQASDGDPKDACELLVKGARSAWQFAEAEINRVPAAAPAAGDALADPALQKLFGEAITGALAFGAQGVNPPPEGHWLAPFWNMARADAALAADLALLDHPLLRDVLGYVEDAGPADVWGAAQSWMSLRDAAIAQQKGEA